jgi:hypothetical protein
MNALTNSSEIDSPAWLNLVRNHVQSMEFGVVQIVIHENRVVQIERTEKVRLDKADSQKSRLLDHQRPKNS